VHGEEVRVRDAQGLGHAGGYQVLADHDALVGVDVAVAAAQRGRLRQPCAPSMPCPLTRKRPSLHTEPPHAVKQRTTDASDRLGGA